MIQIRFKNKADEERFVEIFKNDLQQTGLPAEIEQREELTGACPKCGQGTLRTDDYDYPTLRDICTTAVCENCDAGVKETYELTFQELVEEQK